MASWLESRQSIRLQGNGKNEALFSIPTARICRESACLYSKTRMWVLRAERKWSQAKLAVQVGVTRQTINCIEKGRFHPNLRLAFKIARAFGKRIGEVFIYEDI
jgi:putative transcriptional regulator